MGHLKKFSELRVGDKVAYIGYTYGFQDAGFTVEIHEVVSNGPFRSKSGAVLYGSPSYFEESNDGRVITPATRGNIEAAKFLLRIGARWFRDEVEARFNTVKRVFVVF